ncbi:MAG: asparagine synthase (glutamine-hydrolyzing) [Patescibacteria group bacterium]|nr:asparagine synthase (glutamine-hydrolyzing) [Patescibacteria group bacterium]
MCGIIGFSGPQDQTKLTQGLDLIEHRGRDERIALHVDSFNLGMNRLSIQDLTKGYYPFKFKSKYLIFNGEIYNYPQLKKQLVRQGVNLKTNCDAEVILPLYEQCGTKAFNMIEGMFAIAILDTKNNQLVLARDRAGQKPLYYFFENNQFYFSSEIKVLLKYARSKKVNHDALPTHLKYGQIPSAQTLVSKIKKVLPAHYLVYNSENKTIETKKYWQVKIKKDVKSAGLVQKLDDLLRAAVEKRLLSDCPVGGFLSGGVDSSLITHYAACKIKNFKTFSISFPNAGYKNESSFAQLATNHLGTNHTEITCTADKVKPLIEDIAQRADTPIADPAILPTLLLAKEARKSVKVVLTGEGADELFGGYHRYQKYILHEQLKFLFRKNIVKKISSKLPLIKKVSQAHDWKTYSPLNLFNEKEIDYILINKHNPPALLDVDYNLSTTNPLLFMQLADFKSYLPEQLLMKVDKLTMAENLEARAPFLDSQVIQFALNLPQKQKIRFFQSKFLLRKVASQYLPPTISWRVKHGFSVPLGSWFRNELQDHVYNSLDILKTYKTIFNIDYLEKLIEVHMSGQKNYRDKIWGVVMLGRWLNYHQLEI